MKIAIPTRDGRVDDHFGHCDHYTLFTVDDNKNITAEETLPSPEGCGCKSNIASVLREQGVTVMLAGSMGDGALNVLNGQGIRVLRGCQGNARSLVEAYLKGFVLDSGEGCHHHEGSDHQCASHHEGGEHQCPHHA